MADDVELRERIASVLAGIEVVRRKGATVSTSTAADRILAIPAIRDALERAKK